MILEAAEDRKAWVMSHYPEFNERRVGQMMDADPTPHKSLLPWLAKVASGPEPEIKFPEDTPDVHATLTEFERLKQRNMLPVDKRDINKFTKYGDLREYIAQFAGKAKSPEHVEQAMKHPGMQLVGEDGDYALYRLTSFEATALCAKDAAWCVKLPGYGPGYLRRGPLYVALKAGHPVGLMHPVSGEFKDVHNKPYKGPGLDELRRLAAKAGIAKFKRETNVLRMPKAQPEEDKDYTPAEILKGRWSNLAYQWIMQHPDELASNQLITLAARDTNHATALNLIDRLLQTGQGTIDSLPATLMSKALRIKASDNYWGKRSLYHLAEKHGKRVRRYEDILHGEQEYLEYARALRKSKSSEHKSWEEEWLPKATPGTLVIWARDTGERPAWLRKRLAETPNSAVWYAENVLGGKPMPEAEELIAKDGEAAYNYAEVTGKRFEPGEKAILERGNPQLLAHYAVKILKRPWPEAEDTLLATDLGRNYYGREWPKMYLDLVEETEGDAGLERLEKLIVQSVKDPSKLSQKRRAWYRLIEPRRAKGRTTLLATREGWHAGMFDGQQAIEKAVGPAGWKTISGQQTTNGHRGPVAIISHDGALEAFGLFKRRKSDNEVVGHWYNEQGGGLSSEDIAKYMPLAVRAGLRYGEFADVEKLAHEGETKFTAKQVVDSKSPSVAWNWVLQQTAPVPSSAIVLATKAITGGVSRWGKARRSIPYQNAVNLVQHLVEKCGMKAADLPQGLMTKLGEEVKGVEDITKLVKDIGQRIPQLERSLQTPGDQAKYLAALRDIDRQMADEAQREMLEKMAGTERQLALYGELEIEPPAAVRQHAAQSPRLAYAYVSYVLKNKPFPEGEEALKTDKGMAIHYAETVGKRLKDFEPKLLEDNTPDYQILYYWKHVLKKQPWPEAESRLMTTEHLYELQEYVDAVNNEEGMKGIERLRKLRKAQEAKGEAEQNDWIDEQMDKRYYGGRHVWRQAPAPGQ